jgi:hypothetical protein
MAHAICCSSCKIRERGVEGHPNPEDFFRPGTIPFPGHMPSAAGSFRTRRCPFRRRNLSLYCKQIPVRFATFTAGAHGPPWRHGAA